MYKIISLCDVKVQRVGNLYRKMNMTFDHR